MKKLILFIGVVFFTCSFISVEPSNINGKTDSPNETTLQTSALLRGWSKNRNCLRGYGNCALAVTDETYSGQENAMPVTLELTAANKMKITNNIAKTNEDGNQLVFDNNFSLPSSLAAKLNKSSIVIAKGSYATTKATPYGQTVVTVTAN